MHKLTDEEVDYILNDIIARGIVIEDLQYNLLDHICCIIENEKPKEDNFYRFYERILPRFFSDELKEIQVETDQLLTFKDYYAMKNTLKISGIISAILMLLGAVFKIMHWPGAGLMLVLGAASFSLLFLPLMIVLKLKDEEKTTDKLVLSFGLLLGIGTTLGVLFKVMHWPYANVLMITSNMLFIFAYVPLYFLTRYRRPELKFNTTVNSVLMMACGGMLFSLFNMGYSKSMKNSIAATHEFLIHNTTSLVKANNNIEAQLTTLNGFADIHEESKLLYTRIESIKHQLIAEVEGISIEDAKMLSIYDMNKPNDYKVVNKFSHSSEEFGLQALIDDIEDYNSIVNDVYPIQTEKKVAAEKLQLEQTVVTVLLHELTQIQLHLATTENSYLSYLSGVQ